MAYPPNPKNVPGPFYVRDGCCTACGITENEAPDHFTYDEHGQCYVRKQPCTQQETDQMVQAMWGAEFDCIRYRGRDPDVFQRLGAMGKPHLCDVPPAEGIAVVLKNHVAFVSVDGGSVVLEEVVGDFQSFWVMQENLLKRTYGIALQERMHTMRGPHRSFLWGTMWFEIARYKNRYHRVHVRHLDEGKSRILMSHSQRETIGSRGVSNTLRQWLTQSSRFGNQQWYTAEEWRQGVSGTATPW
jgi:ferredoxin